MSGDEPDDMSGDEPDNVSGDAAEPSVPNELPTYLVEAIERQGPDRLRLVSEYALALAERRERQVERELMAEAEQSTTEVPEEWDGDEWEDALEEATDKAGIAPTKGTITTKTINDNDYYYLQWRDGETVRSQYIAPVTPANGADKSGRQRS